MTAAGVMARIRVERLACQLRRSGFVFVAIIVQQVRPGTAFGRAASSDFSGRDRCGAESNRATSDQGSDRSGSHCAIHNRQEATVSTGITVRQRLPRVSPLFPAYANSLRHQ